MRSLEKQPSLLDPVQKVMTSAHKGQTVEHKVSDNLQRSKFHSCSCIIKTRKLRTSAILRLAPSRRADLLETTSSFLYRQSKCTCSQPELVNCIYLYCLVMATCKTLSQHTVTVSPSLTVLPPPTSRSKYLRPLSAVQLQHEDEKVCRITHEVGLCQCISGRYLPFVLYASRLGFFLSSF